MRGMDDGDGHWAVATADAPSFVVFLHGMLPGVPIRGALPLAFVDLR